MAEKMLISDEILSKSPLKIAWVIVGVALSLLFTVLEPKATLGMSFIPRLVFWSSQIGIGLLGLYLASLLIRNLANSDYPVFLIIIVTGIVGTALAAPVFAAFDHVFPVLVGEPDSWLDTFDKLNPAFAIFAEFFETLPAMLTTWIIINIPLLLHTTLIVNSSSPEVPPSPEPESHVSEIQYDAKKRFLEQLPEAIGHDIVSISSELHYLNVTTTKGKTLILGSLQKTAEIMEEDGFLVHRSYWINKDHVVNTYFSGDKAWCQMTNDSQIPISRSNRKLIKAYFGNYRNSAKPSSQKVYKLK